MPVARKPYSTHTRWMGTQSELVFAISGQFSKIRLPLRSVVSGCLASSWFFSVTLHEHDLIGWAMW